MADKASTTAYGLSTGQANITTSGTTTLNTSIFYFDDATSMQEVIEQLDKHKVQVMDYYSKR